MKTQRTDDFEGYINVRVEPSKSINPGVFIEVNDHFELRTEKESVQNADLMLVTLEKAWTTSLERSSKIASGVMGIQ